MTYIDDLWAERYRRSTWWKTPDPEPVDHEMRMLLRAAEVADEAAVVEMGRAS